MAEEDGADRNAVDVAMFIDWENMHGCIRGKANISALREIAEGYGRLVLARAYADWRESRFQQDSLVLYKIGFEPVYVPSGFKNNVDVKLATDCIDYAYKYPNIRVYVLVTGDGDFIHVVTTLRPLGKKAVVIAQSNNASSRLADLVDTLLIYDKDVNPAAGEGTGRAGPKAATSDRKLEDIFRDIVEILRKEEDKLMLLTNVKQALIRLYGTFEQKEYGFDKFKAMIEAGVKKGYFVVNNAGLRDWLTLPQEDDPSVNGKLPDEVDQVFEEIVGIIRTSPHPQPLLTFIKNALIKKYGGFDESVYGYNQFKQMMESGERMGYFKIGMTDPVTHFVVLPEKENGRGRRRRRTQPA